MKIAQKKSKSKKEIRKALGVQLGYLKRNISSINRLLDTYERIPLKAKDYKYLLVINTLYEQQKSMYETRTHTIDHRIVSIHQPHVRPIVRGKSQAKVEFGAKIHLSLVDGLTYLKELGIKLLAKPLGRPSAVSIHVSPGERNPIEGKFGQAKTGYGLNRIRARLRGTSESWIASIIMVLNLVKLAGEALLCLILKMNVSFSAWLTGIVHLEKMINFYIQGLSLEVYPEKTT